MKNDFYITVFSFIINISFITHLAKYVLVL